MTVNWNMKNAQADLSTRRPRPTGRQVTPEFITQALRTPTEPVAAASPIVTKPHLGFGELKSDHLSSELSVAWPGRNDPVTIRERQIFSDTVAAAQNWVRKRKGTPGLSFVLVAGELPEACRVTDHTGQSINAAAFDGYGCGKTTIARAMYASSQHIAVPVEEWQPPTSTSLNYLAQRLGVTEEQARKTLEEARQTRTLVRPAQLVGGVWITAPELMERMDDKDFRVARLIGSPEVNRVVVIDDVGREGELRFSKRDDDPQLKEKQARYYRVINYCYELFQQGCGISLIVTSNLRLKPLAEFLGGASWSRLLQMSPSGFMRDMTGVRNYRPYIRGE